MNIIKKIKLKLLCTTGFLYFGAIIFVLLGLLVLLAWIASNGKALSAIFKLFVPLAIFCWAMFKGFFTAIFTRLPEPYGITIDRGEYPQVYDFINDIRIKANCPRIYKIKIDFDFNAFITEIPRIGIIGWNRRYLVVGFPLMLALSSQELTAVIAHECGHLSKAHGKHGVEIYRAKTLWERVSEELKKTEKDRVFLIRIFMHRYIVALNDMFFQVSKLQEYEADKTAVKITEKDTFALSLIKLNLYDAYLSTGFWTDIRKLNKDSEKVLDDIYFRLEKACLEKLPVEFYEPFIKNLLKYRSLPSSTHPSYIERFEAVGANISDIEALQENSLRNIFRDKADAILRICSMEWADKAGEKWTEYYKNMKEAQEKLDSLDSENAIRKLELNETIERIEMIEKTQGTDNAIVALREAKQVYSDSNDIDYNLGRLLLYKEEKEGLDLLKEVIDKDFQYIPACSYELVNYFCRNDDRDNAAGYYHLGVEVMESNAEVKSERENIRFSDHFIPHDLAYDTVSDIIDKLSKFKSIKKAYIAIKYTEISSHFPVYIIGIRYKFFASFRWKKIHDELLKSSLLPWEHWIMNLGKNREIEYKFNMIRGCRIL